MTDDEKFLEGKLNQDDEKFLAECEELSQKLPYGFEAKYFPKYTSEKHGNELGEMIGSFKRLIAMVRSLQSQCRERDGINKSLVLTNADVQYAQGQRISQLESALITMNGAFGEICGMLSAHEFVIRQDSGNTNWEVLNAKARAAREKIKEVLG